MSAMWGLNLPMGKKAWVLSCSCHHRFSISPGHMCRGGKGSSVASQNLGITDGCGHWMLYRISGETGPENLWVISDTTPGAFWKRKFIHCLGIKLSDFWFEGVLLVSTVAIRELQASHPSRQLGDIVPIFAWKFTMVSLIFLKQSLVFPILLFSSISLHWSPRKAFWSLCYSLKLCIQMGISFLFSFAFCFSFHSYL